MFRNLNARERTVLDLLVAEEGISVSEMGARLGVSQVTVRNTLNALSEKGVVVRTWGGASPAFHPAILERQRTRHETKALLASAAAELVEDGDTIMVEAGTTTSLVGRYLFGRRDVHVVTNSMLFLPYGRSNPALQVTVVGGSFQAITESLVGPIALRELDEFHVRLAFVGTDGFSVASGATTHLVEGAEIVRRMASRADRTVLLADSTKYGRVGFARVLALEEISLVITDRDLPQEAEAELREAGVELRIVGTEQGGEHGA
ncbi:MAG: DeoR/GlpR family DNA-binding transcription regulator [Spirochaetales bacterium]